MKITRISVQETVEDLQDLEQALRSGPPMAQTDYAAPYAVVYHSQLYEWYGDEGPNDRNNGRYKTKGDGGSILAINIPTKEMAEKIAEEMKQKLDAKGFGTPYKSYYFEDQYYVIYVPMRDLSSHFNVFNEEDEADDPYLPTPSSQYHPELFIDYKWPWLQQQKKEAVMKIQHIKTAQEDLNQFSAPIAIALHMPDVPVLDVNPVPDRVLVQYRMDMEYRSWGLKSVSIHLLGTENIDIEVENLETGAKEMKAIPVDMSQIKFNVQSAEHGAIYVHGPLMLFIRSDFSVDYDRSEIAVMM
jgi:hypothetical protein